jgi:L-iditol 2-dehydrogenase
VIQVGGPRHAAGGEGGIVTEAVACYPVGDVRIEERRLAEPGDGELLLRTSVCGLCGTDLFKLAEGRIAAGTVLGHELVGTVASLGPGVVAFAPGQRVVVPHHAACGICALCRRGSETQCRAFRENLMRPGGFAREVLIRERAVRLAARAIPDNVDDRSAVFMEPAACVLRGVERAGLPGEGGCAAVLGAGSMGLLHVLVLRAVRPDLRIAVSDPMSDRCDAALSLGADVAARPGAPLADGVARLSDGLGADAVFDTVGGNAALNEGVALTRPGGSVVLFAHARPAEPASFELNAFFKNERRLIGTYSGGLGEQARIFAMIVEGRLDASPLVTHTLPFRRFEEAVSLARSRRALKILLTPE